MQRRSATRDAQRVASAQVVREALLESSHGFTGREDRPRKHFSDRLQFRRSEVVAEELDARHSVHLPGTGPRATAAETCDLRLSQLYEPTGAPACHGRTCASKLAASLRRKG